MRVLLLAALLLLPTGAAISIHSDADGQAIPVGAPATFHVVHWEDGQPKFHQDTELEVYLNGEMVYRVDPAAGHEYDGIHSFTLAFGEAGDFEIIAFEDGIIANNYTGKIADYNIERPIIQTDTTPENQGKFVRSTVDMSWDAHTENHIWMYAGTQTLMRTELHNHGNETSQFVRSERSAELAQTHILLQAENGPSMDPVTVKTNLDRAVLIPVEITNTIGVPPSDANAVATSTGDGMNLLGTYDPFTRVGPGTLMRIAVAAQDDAGNLLPHTQFSAQLRGQQGLLWQSDSIHEHDGLWEFASRQVQAGRYLLEVTATNGEATASLQVPYQVTSPISSTIQQLVRATIPENLTAREAQEFSYQISDNADRPFAHSEMEITVLDSDDVPVFVTKIHTHDDGIFPFSYAFPKAGEYRIIADPFPLDQQPASFRGDLEIAVTVAKQEGEFFGNPLLPDLDAGVFSGARPVLIGAAVLFIAGVAGLAIAWRRKERGTHLEIDDELQE